MNTATLAIKLLVHDKLSDPRDDGSYELNLNPDETEQLLRLIDLACLPEAEAETIMQQDMEQYWPGIGAYWAMARQARADLKVLTGHDAG